MFGATSTIFCTLFCTSPPRDFVHFGIRAKSFPQTKIQAIPNEFFTPVSRTSNRTPNYGFGRFRMKNAR